MRNVLKIKKPPHLLGKGAFDFPLGNYVDLENHVGSALVQVHVCCSDIIIRSAIQQHMYIEQKKFIS